ncbi:tetratricopeptide repeat protein [Halobacillus litoralis]|uniref:Tetratricopeptide repeat protein n=1 Tax=Halobacillus litoralis TaxID=45668 RepID=A0A845E3Z6_9BACI|nr:helix-turn-helix domain-containing protein [Halobacillus litoralis]MYL20404.1 tetratricopeptide repeat protein [Halobacillus litoralis]
MKGSLIKQHRTFKNMTLEELASGICSVSYLSKIEHDTINASEEIYRLLGERLNIKLTDLNEEFDENIYDQLIEWHGVIQRRDTLLMEEYHEKCRHLMESNQNTELTNLFTIIHARHKLKINEGPLDLSDVDEINRILPYSTKEYQFFYHKTIGIHYLLDNHQLKKALNHFHQTKELLHKLPYEDSETFFHLALTYSQTRAAVESNYFAQIALEGYIKEFDYERIVDTYMIIALNYRALDIYDIAEEYFVKLLKISKYHLKPLEKRRIFHNLGYIYANQEKYTEALDHIKKAAEIETDEIHFQISTFYLLASIHYYAGKLNEAWEHLREGEAAAKEHQSQFFQYKFYVLKNTIMDTTHDNDFMKTLEDKIVPFSRENNEYGDYKNYCEMLGNLYYEKRMYKKAAMYYKEANHYRETQKKDLL